MAGTGVAAGLLEENPEEPPKDMDHKSSKFPLEAGLAGAAVVVAVGTRPEVAFECISEGVMMDWLENMEFCGTAAVGVM